MAYHSKSGNPHKSTYGSKSGKAMQEKKAGIFPVANKGTINKHSYEADRNGNRK